MEAEIENLSWKVERADSYERGVEQGELSANDRGVRESNGDVQGSYAKAPRNYFLCRCLVLPS